MSSLKDGEDDLASSISSKRWGKFNKRVIESNFESDERMVWHPSYSFANSNEDPKWNKKLCQRNVRIGEERTNVFHQVQLRLLCIGFCPPFRQVEKTIDVEHASPELFVLQQFTESFDFNVNGQTPIGKFIRIVKIQLFNIEGDLQRNLFPSIDRSNGEKEFVLTSSKDLISSSLYWRMWQYVLKRTTTFRSRIQRENGLDGQTSFLATTPPYTCDPSPAAFPTSRLDFVSDNPIRIVRT